MTSSAPTIADEIRGAAAAELPEGATPVARDLAYLRTAIANVVLYGPPECEDRGWVLIDAGMYGSAPAILDASGRRFGRARPAAIVLTHGHFDHVGALRDLAEIWDAPIYAHRLELPYLDGRSSYPPPDPTVGGGMLAALSWMYPRGPIDVGDRLKELPADGSVPGMPGWRWVHTPGHAPGHVSFFREADRALIVGDAFVTTRQESALAVLRQEPEMHGPPMYFTQDWGAARSSVERLAELEPALAITGHGRPVAGEPLRRGLLFLAQEFDRVAVPRYGRYVGHPALFNARGVVSVPPDVPHPLGRFGIGASVGLVAGGLLGRALRARRETR